LRKNIALKTITSPKLKDKAKLRRVKFTTEEGAEDSLRVQVEVRARYDACKIQKNLESLSKELESRAAADPGCIPGFAKVKRLNGEIHIDKSVSRVIRMEEEMHKLTGKKPADEGLARRLDSSDTEGRFGAPLSILRYAKRALNHPQRSRVLPSKEIY
jgi:hypothetical protein